MAVCMVHDLWDLCLVVTLKWAAFTCVYNMRMWSVLHVQCSWSSQYSTTYYGVESIPREFLEVDLDVLLTSDSDGTVIELVERAVAGHSAMGHLHSCPTVPTSKFLCGWALCAPSLSLLLIAITRSCLYLVHTCLHVASSSASRQHSFSTCSYKETPILPVLCFQDQISNN